MKLKTFVGFLFSIAVQMTVEAQSLPIANDDFFTVQKNQITALPVSSNDFDVDGDSLSISLLTGPVHGTGIVNGLLISYTPLTNYTGGDTLTYSICETGTVNCDTSTVFITISGINTPPGVNITEVYFGDSISSVLINPEAYDTDGDSIFINGVWSTDTNNTLGQLLTQGLQFIFVRNELSCGSTTFLYSLCDALICDTFQLTVQIVCPNDITLVQGISPDGDGKNDLLIFEGLQHFSPASLQIFNRYGTTVFETDNYKNDWSGTANESSNALPDGTYYYVLNLADGRKYNNFLVINR